MYEIETRKHEPKNIFAGDFPTVAETGVAGEDLGEYMPVALNEAGKIVKVKKETEKVTSVVGITAAAAKAEEPVAYYMTGEFFADALEMPEGVEVKDVKEALRGISIFLRDGNALGK